MPLGSGKKQLHSAVSSELAARVEAECEATGTSVSAYIASLIESHTWVLDRAAQRLAEMGVLEAEVKRLAEVASEAEEGRGERISPIDAAKAWVEARKMGRLVGLEVKP